MILQTLFLTQFSLLKQIYEELFHLYDPDQKILNINNNIDINIHMLFSSILHKSYFVSVLFIFTIFIDLNLLKYFNGHIL